MGDKNSPQSASADAKKETPNTPPASLPPAKKFERAESPAAKRGPGRPPKPNLSRGPADSQVSAGRTGAATAAASAPAYTAKPDPGPLSAPAAIRGLLNTLTPIAGMVTAMATKIELLKAIQIWQFSESELRQIEKPGGAFLEKYAPYLDDFGIEIEFAGACFSVIFPKMLAIVAAKKLLEASQPRAAQPDPKPAPAPTPIRATPPAPAPQPENRMPAADFEVEVEGQLPSPFAAELNAGMVSAGHAL
jgi:hypothetical protein